MFCSSCGTTVAHGLAYCNHCGEKLITAQASAVQKPEAEPESLVWAIVGVFAVGMGTIIGLMAVMKTQLHFELGPLLFFSILSFALMIGIEAVFIWLLLSRSRVRKVLSEKTEDRHTTKELGSAPARVLSEPISSVTEEATRTFHPIYEKRK